MVYSDDFEDREDCEDRSDLQYRIDDLEQRLDELNNKIETLEKKASQGEKGASILFVFGSALSMILSWSRNASILWCILHGFFSWLYVIYFACTR